MKPGVCQVCGDKASIVNYGALSCQPCKAFFRRNGFHPQNVRPCLFYNSCEVNINTRRCCTACRLAKCFVVGMSSDLIRKEVRRNTKHLPSSSQSGTGRHVVSKQAIPILQLSTPNKLPKNQPLKNSEWILLSKIIQAHDTSSTMLHIRHPVECLPALSLDQTNALEMVTVMYTSMQSFISSSPDFVKHTANEQFTLLKCNLLVITLFCFVLISSNEMINNESTYIDFWTTIYGSDTVLQAKRIDKQLLNDLTIIKLMLIVLTFSSNCSIIDEHEDMSNDNLFHDTHRFLRSQNVYVELLWKYTIYRYGYYDAIPRFSRLINVFLNLIKHFAIAYRDNAIYRQLGDNIFRKIKQSFVINLTKQVPQWENYDL